MLALQTVLKTRMKCAIISKAIDRKRVNAKKKLCGALALRVWQLEELRL